MNDTAPGNGKERQTGKENSRFHGIVSGPHCAGCPSPATTNATTHVPTQTGRYRLDLSFPGVRSRAHQAGGTSGTDKAEPGRPQCIQLSSCYVPLAPGCRMGMRTEFRHASLVHGWYASRRLVPQEPEKDTPARCRLSKPASRGGHIACKGPLRSISPRRSSPNSLLAES